MKQYYYLLDTNIIGFLIEFKSGYISQKTKALEKHWNTLSENTRLFLCPITVGEIEYGLRVAPYSEEELRDKIRKEISKLDFFDIDENIARDYYAELRARLFNRYAPKDKKNRRNYNKRIEEWRDPTTSKLLQIQENDLWIAAVAMAHNLILVTNDKMEAIKNVASADLRFEDWLK
jgi:tRNA(fMet)-specific endonuclease VapC